MKPSERISEIYNKLREEHGIIFAPPDLYSKAISIYIDEEWEQKQIAKEIKKEAIEELKRRADNP